jgi:hypothetical protein
MGSGRVESEQKVLTISLIRSVSIALLGCMLVSSPLYGQSESTLKKFFEGKITVVRIDMPGSQHGVDVYPKRAESIDWREWRSELKKYGTALSRGQKVTITKIKTKWRHLEFQLDGGGWGTVTSNTAGWPGEHKSRREKELGREIAKETDPERKERMEDELDRLERERSSRNDSSEMQEKINAWEKTKRLAGGSRFNIRYESWLTDGDKTPETVMAALSEYLDFPAVAPPPLPPPPPPPKLYPIDESHLDPSFAEFKTRLLEAVERRDLDFLLSIVHPKIYLGYERGSPETLKRVWEARDWQELRHMLSLGAVRSSYGFCAPYVSTKFPDELDALKSVVITDSDVPVRAEPNSTAPIIDRLSYDIVSHLSRGRGASWDTIEGEEYQWWRIETPSGEAGYVWGKYARRPIDMWVCFDKSDGHWLMTSWASGD